MKNINKILFLGLIMFSATIHAEPYAGVFWLGNSTDSASGAETDNADPGAAFVIGGRTTGKYGFFGEGGFSKEGVLGAAGGYAMLGPIELSLAAAVLPDTSEGATRLGVDKSTEYGVGPMIGLRWKWLSARATQYDVDHNYNVTLTNDVGEVVDSANASSSIRRNVYWLGVIIPLN